MKIKYNYLIFSIAILSVIIRMFFLHPTLSDENFYFNAAKAFISGSIPYKDFFFAHPPFQLFLLGVIFKIFGTSFLIAKLVPLAFSTLSFILVFFVGRNFFDEKTAFVSAIIFLIVPQFISFSLIDVGIFETMTFLLLSLFFYSKDKVIFSAIFFAISIYFRYLVAPFLLVFYIFDKKRFRQFFLYSFAIAVSLFAIFYLIFGFNYVRDTIFFQILSKTSLGISSEFNFPLLKSNLEFDFPLIIFSLVAIVLGLRKKEKLLALLAALPIAFDVALFLIIKNPVYQYFLFSLPLYALVAGRLFVKINDKIIRILIFGVIFFSIFSNIITIDYFLNPLHSKKYFEIADFIARNSIKSDKIVGEPSVASFVAFTQNVSIPIKYTDLFIGHVMFEGPSDFISVMNNEKPKFFIEVYSLNSPYYFRFPEIEQYVVQHYNSVLNTTGIPNYYVYQLKG
jgi:4-amino-4-deoxy-L-arabinose transferase-like glycosyltransferase